MCFLLSGQLDAVDWRVLDFRRRRFVAPHVPSRGGFSGKKLDAG